MKTLALFSFSVLLAAGTTGCTGSSSSVQTMTENDGSVRIVENPSGPLYLCDLDIKKDTIDFPLSELVEDCRIIRLDNSDEALFKAWWISATENYIGIRQQGAAFKLFGKDGKFLCDVGKIGNGPGEYALSLYDEIIDEKGGHIFFTPFTGDKILMYDLNGNWIKDIKLPGKINKAKMQMNADGTISVVHMPFEAGSPFAFQMDTAGNILKQLPAQSYMTVQSFDGEIFSYQNTGTFDFLHTSIDTVFQYDVTANQLVPRFTMNFPGMAEKPIHIYTELPNHVITTYYFWKGDHVEGGGVYLVDKQKKSSAHFNLVNDFFGNLPIPNPNIHFNKGYFIFNIEPGNLGELIAAHLSSGNCPEKEEAKLKELAASLKENDNNLLFIGKLKR